MNSRQQYLNTKQAAQFLGLSHRTLEIWRVQGKGPRYAKFGSRVLYPSENLQEWASNKVFSNTSEQTS